MNKFEKQAFTINEFCHLYSIGRTKTYSEIKEGNLKVKKLGRKTIVTAEAAQEWLEAIPESASHEA